jgi:flagellar motor switch protein FliN/FliY
MALNSQEMPVNLDLLLDVPVSVTVELGSTKLPMREVLALTSGSIIKLDKMAEEPVELLVNGKRLARGEVVVVDNKFGIKITEIIGGQ